MFFGLVLACLLSSFLSMRILDGRDTRSSATWLLFSFAEFHDFTPELVCQLHVPHHGNLGT